MAGIGLALQAMWAANVLDIQKTLHQVCLGGEDMLMDCGLFVGRTGSRLVTDAKVWRSACRFDVRWWACTLAFLCPHLSRLFTPPTSLPALLSPSFTHILLYTHRCASGC